ncbi:helix-turn-helix domain-containing protein [Haloarchaeobius sp. HME9146]|uniref:helix-turn-helix domain-containing protein n=1 Tax=Haloarchaeobius sp. HME9146 TaxID=2978732 RepID=UPI0021C01323|nr:helix-turn-helix domain-containing protein [Haloarchaeobius sp. HME9146]MCT9096758.1 helix-turn-helix domain-containing protein [Haloarchaeobius sp. HME9146]
MTGASQTNEGGRFMGTRLTLDLWHPNCWACESTEDVDGGVIAHAIYDGPDGSVDQTVRGLFTAYGETTGEVEDLLAIIQDSRLTGEVKELQERFDYAGQSTTPGNVAREFFLDYDPGDMVCPTLLSHGFVHNAPCRIEDGRESWQVVFSGTRDQVEPELDAVREEAGADIEVASITSFDTPLNDKRWRMDSLTDTQREVFEHARERGYYQWPRGVSTRELASELEVSKTTLLEHLRKAESKLLDPESN